jgi:hypothetical protein
MPDRVLVKSGKSPKDIDGIIGMSKAVFESKFVTSPVTLKKSMGIGDFEFPVYKSLYLLPSPYYYVGRG